MKYVSVNNLRLSVVTVKQILIKTFKHMHFQNVFLYINTIQLEITWEPLKYQKSTVLADMKSDTL